MANSRETLRLLDAQIHAGLDAAGLADQAIVRGRPVPGYYRRVFVDEGVGEEAVAGFVQLFDCREEDLVDELAEGDPIEVTGQGKFRVVRSESDGTGRVVIRLGTFL